MFRGGTSQASNLTGLLTSMGNTIGQMGGAGEAYIDSFKRQMAPDVDMNDSASLFSYAQWARRNGYEDEARQYLALGYQREAAEEEKEYNTYVASNTEKLRGFNTSIANLEKAVADGDPNAQRALDRVKSARDQHIGAMNEYGNNSDYGDGSEGGKAERALIKETIAANDATLKKQKLILEIGNMQAELEDFIAEGEPIDLSLIPPNLREKYQAQLKQAEQDPRGSKTAIRRINEVFREPSKDYIAGLAKGDQGTKVLLAEAQKSLRDLDSDLADFFSDTDNTEVLKMVRQAAEDELLSNPNYRLMSKPEQKVEARAVFTRLLRAESEEFDREYKNAYRTAQGGKNSADQTAEDIERRYDAGMEPGGDQYKAALANAQKAKGESFDRQAFDAAWDRRFYNPFGSVTMPAPIY